MARIARSFFVYIWGQAVFACLENYQGMTGSCGQIKTKSVSFPVSSGAFSSAKRRNKKLKQIHVK